MIKALLIMIFLFPLLAFSEIYTHDFDTIGDWKSWLEITQMDGFVRFTEVVPPLDDDNHEEMIGILHLVSWLHIGPNPPCEEGADLCNGKVADFRNAKVTVKLRGNDFKPNGSEFIWWQESQTPETFPLRDIENHPIRANWAYTGMPLTQYLLDGDWHIVEFLLDPNAVWTYAGNNPHQGYSAKRYSYWPIEDALKNANLDFIFVLAGVNKDNYPTGSIDFDYIKIEYNCER